MDLAFLILFKITAAGSLAKHGLLLAKNKNLGVTFGERKPILKYVIKSQTS